MEDESGKWSMTINGRTTITVSEDRRLPVEDDEDEKKQCILISGQSYHSFTLPPSKVGQFVVLMKKIA